MWEETNQRTDMHICITHGRTIVQSYESLGRGGGGQWPMGGITAGLGGETFVILSKIKINFKKDTPCFSNFNVHQHDLEGLLEHNCWAPPPQFLISLKQSSKICVSRTFPDDSNGDGPGSPL